jgi:MerR family copper efflux transcriptional regulator
MLIGELAKRSGVPAKTIRYYEDIEILPPPRRTPGGYRDYDETTVDRLAFVRAAQAASLTLAEIRKVVALRDRGLAPCSHVIALLDAKAEAVAEQIASLRSLQADVEQLRNQAGGIDPADCDPRSICEVLVPPTR